MEYFFPAPHIQSVCIFQTEVSLLQAAYKWVMLFDPLRYPITFYWRLDPFTFKVIIDKYVYIAIWVTVFACFVVLLLSSFALSLLSAGFLAFFVGLRSL